MEEDDIINNEFLINPTAGRGLSGIATSAEPLLAQGSQLTDIQEIEPGAFVDRTSVTNLNDLFNFYYGGMPSQQPVVETPAVEAPAVEAPVVDTGVQDQATGDTVNQPLVESGEFGGQPTFTTTPGTTVDPITGDITSPDGTPSGNIVDEFLPTAGTFAGQPVVTTQIGTQVDDVTGDITRPDEIPGGNIVDEFGVAGDVYSGAQGPTGIGTGNVLDEFGIAGDVYAQPVFDYEFEATTPEQRTEALTQEEIENTGIVEKARNALGNVTSDQVVKAVQRGRIGLAALTGGSSEVIKEIAKQIGGFFVTDAVADVTADKLLQATGAITPTSTAEDISLNLQQEQASLDPDQNIIDEVALTGQEKPAIDPAPSTDFSGYDAGGFDPAPSPDFSGDDSGGFDPAPSTDFSGYDSGGYDPAPAPVNDPTDRGGGDSGGGGGGKIVCTMMNETYGFGSFRNKIWLRQSKDLAPEYQKGYHILFLPLVKVAETNKIVRKILEHIAVHRTIDIRQESRGKTHMLGRIYRKILEPICFIVGKVSNND